MANLILTEGIVEEGFTTTVEFARKNVKVVNKETGEVIVGGGSPSSSKKRKSAPSPTPPATKLNQWKVKVSEYETMSKNMDLSKETRDVAADAWTTITEVMNGYGHGLGTQGTPAQEAQEEEASDNQPIPRRSRNRSEDVAAALTKEAEAAHGEEDDNSTKKKPARKKPSPKKRKSTRNASKKKSN